MWSSWVVAVAMLTVIHQLLTFIFIVYSYVDNLWVLRRMWKHTCTNDYQHVGNNYSLTILSGLSARKQIHLPQGTSVSPAFFLWENEFLTTGDERYGVRWVYFSFHYVISFKSQLKKSFQKWKACLKWEEN